jgi:hypothetical protein
MYTCFLIVPTEDWEHTREWRRVDTGEKATLQNMPIGAMYYAPWMARCPEPDWLSSTESKQLPQEERLKGHLMVKTPGGFWDMDAPAYQKTSGWTRTGTPPNITARPSIFHDPTNNGWHGWLTDGVLKEVGEP